MKWPTWPLVRQLGLALVYDEDFHMTWQTIPIRDDDDDEEEAAAAIQKQNPSRDTQVEDNESCALMISSLYLLLLSSWPGASWARLRACIRVVAG